LNVPSIEGERIIVIDVSGCFKAEDVLEVDALRAAVDIREMISPGKTGIVLLEIGLVEKAVCILDGGDIASAEGLDETVLMGTVGAFDPALAGESRHG